MCLGVVSATDPLIVAYFLLISFDIGFGHSFIQREKVSILDETVFLCVALPGPGELSWDLQMLYIVNTVNSSVVSLFYPTLDGVANIL